MTANNLIIFQIYSGADITLCTKEGDTPMFLAVYRVTKKPRAFDPESINILYNAGTLLLCKKDPSYITIVSVFIYFRYKSTV
jgi:hypothetical protein